MSTLTYLTKAAVVTAALALPAATASAAVQCYPQGFSATSPGGNNTHKTEDAAHVAAIGAWEVGIAAQLGTIFADWDLASERTKACTQHSDGYGGYYYACEIAGYPCYEVPVYTPPKAEGGYTPPKSSY